MSRNAEIADSLERLGKIYQLKEDKFRSVSFLSAARLIRGCVDIETINPKSLDGIGSSIAEVITQLLNTGTCNKLQEFELDQSIINLLELT